MSKCVSTLDSQQSRVYQIGNNLVRNFIGEGFDISPNGLSVDVSPGYCDIDGKYHETTEVINQVLPPRSAGLLYAQKSTYSDCPQFGYVPAVFPEVDANTVGMWIIDGSSSIPNSAVGVNGNTIAVTNNLTKGGTINQVDGWLGYAGKGDGTTGYYQSQNYTGFPAYSSDAHYRAFFRFYKSSATQYIFFNGISSLRIVANSTRLSFVTAAGSFTDSGFDFENGKDYLVDIYGTGSSGYVCINGSPVFNGVTFWNQTASVLKLFDDGSLTAYSPSILYFIQLRNSLPTLAQIAQIANKLCLPCSYTGYSASYPTISDADKATAWHEWKFDESSGAAVADTAGTLNGTATGTTIVDSEIGLGKARKFTSVNDYITLGNFAFAANWTIVAVLKPTSFANMQSILNNRNATVGNYAGVNTDGTLNFNNYASNNYSKSQLNLGTSNFAVFRYQNGGVDYCVNSANPENFTTITQNTTTQIAYISKDGYGSDFHLNSILEYLLYIPRALSQAEIAVIYDALMKKSTKDIREIIPDNAVSLGFARTNSNAVIEIDEAYRTGRREGAVGGNRKQFLGWKYFSGATTLNWNHPFDTRKIRYWFTVALGANGLGEMLANHYYTYGGYGYDIYSILKSNGIINGNVQAYGVNYTTGVITSGYIGCYAEVLEDD
jgi:hypothetical protein